MFPNALIHVVSRQQLPEVAFVFQDLEQIINLNVYDYYVLSSETEKHYEQFLYLEEKVVGKTILMEKPLFSSYKPVFSTKNSWYVGYNLRYHPVITYLIPALKNEKILSAQVYAGQYLPQWRPNTDYSQSYSVSKIKGGGVLLDLSHEIDYSIKMFGNFEKVQGFVGHISSLPGDSEDYASFIGITSNRVMVNLTLDYLSQVPYRKIIIQCEGKTITADLISNTVVSVIESKIKNIEIESISDRNQTYIEMHKSVLVKDGCACSLHEGLEILKIIDKIKLESYERS